MPLTTRETARKRSVVAQDSCFNMKTFPVTTGPACIPRVPRVGSLFRPNRRLLLLAGGPKKTPDPLGALSRPATRLLLSALILLSGGTLVAAEDTATAYQEPPITDDDRQHWAFQPVVKVRVPKSDFPQRRRNEIDDFIGRTLKRNKLFPQPSASKRTLIRRLSFDLIGLPPTPSDLDAFVADANGDAYEQLVDRLLASPAHGERWAQHWLDLARFAETDGFEHDKTRPDAWKYRDWVIQALNSDMPYDEFIRQQIAGDELYPDDESALTATRFCLSCPDMPDINLEKERLHTLLNEMTSTVGEVILGLQIGCAQCHDHKYDPLSQADFYRLRAVFEPAVHLEKNKSLSVFSEQFPYQGTSHLMHRGDFRREGPEVLSGVPRVATPGSELLKPSPTKRSAGRRTALVEWLVSADNPLTARVIVNRVWQHHFGRGLVDSPSDFGIMGMEPSHPELLDWLANWFVEQKWSLRRLHRLIVTSATWRQRSVLPDRASVEDRAAWQFMLTTDPDNRLLSHFPRLRLEGEVIRDAMLAAAGQLNRKMGGPGTRPPLPNELVGTLLKNQWNVTKDETEHSRRSIYVFARRNLRYPIFEVFDRPSANTSCAERGMSTTAPQSLHLVNSEFSLAMAGDLATEIHQMQQNEQQNIEDTFRRTLGRSPTANELQAAGRFLAASSESHEDTDPLTHLCLSLFNCNEFIFID